MIIIWSWNLQGAVKSLFQMQVCNFLLKPPIYKRRRPKVGRAIVYHESPPGLPTKSGHTNQIHNQENLRIITYSGSYSFFSAVRKVATDTYTVQVLPKILYFWLLISYSIWYTENYWLAHNFPDICPIRPLPWFLNLWSTARRSSQSSKTKTLMKKMDN